MFFKTIKSAGLSQLSYILGDDDTGECIVIDPRRDTNIYLQIAAENDSRITGIFETHLHADFVSGSHQLRADCGAPILGGASDEVQFDYVPLNDGETFTIGDLTLTALHTPGHSPEHLSYLIEGGEGASKPWGLFTGDTLFAGSVGRPDLSAGVSSEDLAERLHRSLFEKILKLPDGIIVYPGHGSGSPCGGSIGDRDQTTIGYERLNNPKLQKTEVNDFKEAVAADLPDEPAYYKRLKALNKKGAKVTGGIPALGALTAQELKNQMASAHALVLDVREVTAFGGGHIPGAIHLALRLSFDSWAGRILPADQPIYLVGEDLQDVQKAHRHLYRMGFDEVRGYLLGGMRTWISSGQPLATLSLYSVNDLNERLQQAQNEMTLLDVRSKAEWQQGHLPGATHLFAAELPEQLDSFDADKEIITYCGSDFRASLGASLLKRKTGTDVGVLLGSMKAWKQSGLSLEE